MASTDRGAATPGYEPQPRSGHALVEYKGCTYLVGGRDSNHSPVGLSSVEVLNPTTLKWQRHTTSGETPVQVFCAACAVVHNCLYVFGGEGVDGKVSNALWRLDLESLQWSPVQQANKPPPRHSAGLVADKQQRLVQYGGVGVYGETLEDLHVFSIKDGEWTSPSVTGTPPPPFPGFSFTLVGSRAVWCRGGSGVYCFDIDKKHWSEEVTSGPQPPMRYEHAAVALSSQSLLVSGGLSGGTLADCWILDLSSRRWREVELPGGGEWRRYHTAAAVRSGKTVYVIEFGGLNFSYTRLAVTTILQMSVDSEDEGVAGNWRLMKYSSLEVLAVEHRRMYEEALAIGYINTRNSVVVLNGAGGSGKTHVKEAMCNRPPPSVRESTALSEDPITFFIIDASGSQWSVLSKERQVDMLASAMAAMATMKQNDKMHPQSTPPTDSARPSPATDTIQTATSSSSAMALPPPTATPTLEPVELAPPTPPSPPLQPRRTEAHHEEPHPVESDFVDRIGRMQAAVEEPYNYDLVYLFDTGGQPAFHAILPLFFPLVMFILFVLKLSQKLDHHPMVHFFVRGKPVGAPYTSPLSHIEIAQHSFCAVQSQMLAQQRSGTGLPKMMIVGTHRDKERHCSESVREKNRKLSEILSPSFKEHLIYRSAEGNSLIFPLDAKHRKQKDCEVAAEIRQAITMATSEIERKQTPLSWHVLELALRELAGKLDRGFLTRAECITEALKLDISERVFDAALNHFIHLNTILYYRTVLPDLVFIQAQPLMLKITELIQHTHALRGQVPDKRTAIQGKWLKFRDEGVVTLDILESFPDSYLEGVFTAADLVRLMEHKLLVSSIDQSSYFMPILLPDLSPEEVAQHRAGPKSTIAPLTILFPCDLVPIGLFCSLVSSLLSVATPPQLRLKVSPSDRALMECVASNCIKFSLYNDISLVLINAYSHLELHLSAPLREDPAPLCLTLKAKVLASIATATHALHFDELESPQCGFLCEASTPHTKVRVTPDRHWLGRLVFGDPRQVEVAPPTHPALLCGGHGWACSLDRDLVHGKLEKRHTVWLQDLPPTEDSSVLPHAQPKARPLLPPPSPLLLDDRVCGRFQERHTVCVQPSGEQFPVVGAVEGRAGGGGGAEEGALVGHPSDAIFDQFPDCNTVPALEPGDLGQVLKILHDAGLAAKWRAIGQTLTVSDANLAGFDARFSSDPSLCLLQVVASWLRGQKRLPDPPSWWMLVWAVADPQGGGTVHGGKRMAAMLRAQGGLSKFVVTSIHAKETPPTPLLDDFSGGPHIYDGVDEATEALSRELSAVAHRWVQVGVLLGVAFSWLEQRSARQTYQQNLRETLCHWLDTLGEAVTLQRLVEAVEHSAGGSNPTLAAAIKSKLESAAAVAGSCS